MIIQHLNHTQHGLSPRARITERRVIRHARPGYESESPAGTTVPHEVERRVVDDEAPLPRLHRRPTLIISSPSSSASRSPLTSAARSSLELHKTCRAHPRRQAEVRGGAAILRALAVAPHASCFGKPLRGRDPTGRRPTPSRAPSSPRRDRSAAAPWRPCTGRTVRASFHAAEEVSSLSSRRREEAFKNAQAPPVGRGRGRLTVLARSVTSTTH